MQYETLYLNDNGTAKVRMTIGSNTLDQDIPVGSTADEFDATVKAAMAVFQAELTANTPAPGYSPPIGEPETVTSLPGA